jgi:FHA domain
VGVVLEIRDGPLAGKVIGLKMGETVTFGRAAGRAQFALPHDTFMSGVHFAVECGSSGCRVQDRKSSNGTFLNGARIQDAMLANGDEIKSGQTIFAVKIVPDAKLAFLLVPQEVPEPPVAERPARQAEPVPPSLPPPREGPAPERSSPVMHAVDSEAEVAEPRRAPDIAAELSEPSAPRFLGALEAPELPARGSGPQAAPPPLGEFPPVEEPARLRAIRKPPGVLGQPQRGSENSPDASSNSSGAAVKRPRPGEPLPNVGAKLPESAQPQGSEPPAGVAPYMAEKFAERPPLRSAGNARGFSVMGWSFPATPADWQVQEGFGLQQSGHEEFPSSVAASEELLGGITLQQFVESQISMLRGYLRDPKIEPTMPPGVVGADESMAMDVRHLTKDGRELVYRRIYARSGLSVGVLTVTTLASDLPQVLESLEPFLGGAAFRATVDP